MLSTALSFLAAVALLIPGFIITEVSRDKSSRSPQHDLELALRSLAYTLFVQLIFGAWTAHLVKTLGPSTEWADHLSAISAYLAVVVLGAPIAFGLALSAYLNRVELRDGPPSTFANALGAGRARDAFDYAYQRWRKEGVYVIGGASRPYHLGATSCWWHLREALGGRPDPRASRHLPGSPMHGRGRHRWHPFSCCASRTRPGGLYPCPADCSR